MRAAWREANKFVLRSGRARNLFLRDFRRLLLLCSFCIRFRGGKRPNTSVSRLFAAISLS